MAVALRGDTRGMLKKADVCKVVVGSEWLIRAVSAELALSSSKSYVSGAFSPGIRIILPSNAFSSLVVTGLIKSNHTETRLICSRGTSVPTELMYSNTEENTRPDGFYICPPSTLPPPGDLTLEVSVQAKLGEGRVGFVYGVDKRGTSGSHAIPDLVIKVARRYQSNNLCREAWFYEEMEHLQGIIVARCYGIFQVVLDEQYEVLDWEKVNQEDATRASEEVIARQKSAMYAKEEAQEQNTAFKRLEYSESIHPHARIPHDISQSEHHHLLSVLVLEKLGERIPKCVPLPVTVPELVETFSHLCQMGIQHRDVRWYNILRAPNSMENPVCPTHNHVHEWRIVDFDLAAKTAFNERLLLSWDTNCLEDMCWDLEYNVGPVDWEGYDGGGDGRTDEW
ncbi:hypothetical protein BU17DRAFT_96242 [Hysterangium stoloniferum]|nr:hypothetical protein BU17DRAFT_96242 [Hysterangium stoloniferum]